MTIGNDPIGKKNQGEPDDFNGVPYVFGENTIMGHLNTAYYHIHGQSFVYPDHADAVILTSAAGAWSTSGAIVEVIPPATLTLSAFDLHFINISDISVVSQIQVDIFSGAIGSETRISATRSQRNTNQSRENANRIQIPQQPPGTRISCRLSDSTTGTVTTAISFEGHFYA